MWRFSILISLALGVPSSGNAAEPARTVDFNGDIRPILSDNCFACHGPDKSQRQGGTEGLRLDTPEGAFADLGGYSVIVRGKPEESELIRRIESTIVGEVMPPRETGKRLTPAEIELLNRWIREGASYARHWAYVKPTRPQLPPIQDASWPRNEIDYFILSRLEKEGLKPSPRADRSALVRRLSLDLTGLPPTLAEVDAFLNDDRPDAYERLVDRLLAKESFGEHWARMWLDLARYADSAGYADDPPRTIWAYRDYVIRSFNANKPFDQFTIEQIAGDLLPNPTNEQLIATAFHRNTLTNNEGGTIDEEFRNVAVVDRVNTTMAVWMGTTMACAQCHSHKYDPITQKEYFQFFAFFNNTADADRRDESPLLEIYTDEQLKQKAAWQTETAELEQRVKTLTPELKTALAKWEQRLGRPLSWRDVRSESSSEGKTLRLRFALEQDEKLSALRLTLLPKADSEEIAISHIEAKIIPPGKPAASGRFVRVEIPGNRKILSLAEVQVYSDGKNIAPTGKTTQSSTAYEGPAKLAIDGNTDGHYFSAGSTTHTAASKNPWWQLDLGKTVPIDRLVIWNRTDGGTGSRLKDFRIAVLDENQKPVWEQTVSTPPQPNAEFAFDGVRPVRFASAVSEEQQLNGLLQDSPRGNAPAWKITPNAHSKKPLILLLDTPVEVPAGSAFEITLQQKSKKPIESGVDFKMEFTADPRAEELAKIPAEALAVLRTSRDERSTQEQAKLAEHFLAITPELQRERNRLARLKKQLADQKPRTTVPIMRELPEDKRRATKVQIRGNYLSTEDEVLHEGVPAVFHPLPEDLPKNRLALAHWLIDEGNPLTARVIANRYWEKIFGVGLVETSEEFGSQGEPPSHPQLLDWLATELVRNGWDTKAFLKLLVTSAAYRQSAQVTPMLLQKDPDNRLLARGARFRMSAEMIRDQALFVSGLLSSKMFGPPVKPPQPQLNVRAAFGSGIDWKTSTGADKYRRGLYTMWRRSNPYPSMAAFDAPNRAVCTLRRDRTNTPLQALVTLNDPVYVEAAQALGRRMAEAEGDLEDKIRYGFRLCLARPPSDEETVRLVKLYDSAHKRYTTDPALAEKMATDPIGPLPKDAKAPEYAAWALVGNVLLNLDEMLMRR